MGGICRGSRVLWWGAGEGFQDSCWVPPANLYRTASGWLVKLELAEVRPEDIEWRICGSRLVVRGTRRDLLAREGAQPYRLEIAYSRFERVLDFPGPVRSWSARTEYWRGMFLLQVEAEGGS